MNLHDPGTLKALLGRHQIAASKGLGQHFLVSKSVVEQIVSCFAGCEGILEIGPGPGVLTGPLSRLARRTLALELDERMIEVLAEAAPDATVLRQDALKADLPSLLAELPAPRGVVSNLPYYITGPLLTRIAEARDHYAKAVLMMQKEVGERVLAKERTPARGSLSVYMQTLFEIRRVAVAPAGAFLPPPKVDSVVLELIPRPSGLALDQEDPFLRFMRQGFTQPRKTLANNLASLAHGREAALSWISSAGFSPTVRPQELSNEEWQKLWRAART